MSPAVFAQLEQVAPVVRLAGATREQTSVEVARWALDHDSRVDKPLIGVGANAFPDGLVAGAFAGRVAGVVVLLGTNCTDDAMGLVSENGDRLGQAIVVGGPLAVSETRLGWLSDGLNGVGQCDALPPVEFHYTMLRNRVSNHPSVSRMWLPRLNQITTELGGRVTFTYGSPLNTAPNGENTCREELGFRQIHRTDHCFPAFISPTGGASGVGLQYRYVVTQLTTEDDFSGNAAQRTDYHYGASRNAYGRNPGISDGDGFYPGTGFTLQGGAHRTWDDFRGHEWVDVFTFDSEGKPVRTRHRFYLGMDHDRSSTIRNRHLGHQHVRLESGTQIEDYRQLAGHPLQVLEYDHNTDDLVSETTYRYTLVTTDGRNTAREDVYSAGPVKNESYQIGIQQAETTVDGVTHVSFSRSDEYGNVVYTKEYQRGNETDSHETLRSFRQPGPAHIASAVAIEETLNRGQTTGRTVYGYDGQIPNNDARTPVGLPSVTTTRSYRGHSEWADMSTAYDSAGRPTIVTDSKGRTITTEYDRRYGTATATTTPLGHTTRYRYDPHFHQLIEVTDPNSLVTTSVFDPVGRIVSVRLPGDDRETYRYGYDLTQQPARVETHQHTESDHYLSGATFHDGFGQVIQTQAVSSTPGYRSVSSTQLDMAGAVAAQTAPYDVAGNDFRFEPVQNWTQFAHATRTVVQGRRVQREQQLSHGGLVSETVTQRDGFSATTTRPDGQRIRSESNHWGQTVSVSEHNGTGWDTTLFTYNGAGQLTTATDPGGSSTRTTWNWSGWKTSMETVYPGRNPQRWTYAYDPAGNVVRQTDPNNQTVHFTYDQLDRLVGRGTTPGSDDLASYHYVEQPGWYGLLQSKTSSTPMGQATTSFGYDERNRITTKTWEMPGFDPITMNWTFNQADQLTTVTYPSVFGRQAETVRQNFDDAGRLASVYGDTTYLSDARYTPDGQVESQRLVGNITRSVSFDSATLRPTVVTAHRGNETLQGLHLTWDNSGRIRQIRDEMNAGQTQCFEYDLRDRLTHAHTGTVGCVADPSVGADPFNQDYTYSADNTIQTRGDVTYTTSAHRVDTATTTDGVYRFTYDQAGNMTYQINDDLGMNYHLEYNVDNRLETVTNGIATAVVSFGYDAERARILQYSASQSETTAWIDDLVEVTRTDSGQLTYTFRYLAGDQLLAQRRIVGTDATTDQVSVTLVDHLGSPTTSVVYGEAPEFFRYDPWGNPRNPSAVRITSRGFTGANTTTDLGWEWLGSRHYNPITGQFTSPDSVLPAPGSADHNRYGYMSNNPQGGRDPSGHFAIISTILVGAAIGAVAGGAVSVVSQLAQDGFSSESFADLDWNQVGRAAVAGGVSGAIAGGVAVAGAACGASFLGVSAATRLGIDAAGGAVTSVAGGITYRLMENAMEPGVPLTEGVFDPETLLKEAAIGAVFGVAFNVSLRGETSASRAPMAPQRGSTDPGYIARDSALRNEEMFIRTRLWRFRKRSIFDIRPDAIVARGFRWRQTQIRHVAHGHVGPTQGRFSQLQHYAAISEREGYLPVTFSIYPEGRTPPSIDPAFTEALRDINVTVRLVHFNPF